MASRRRHPGRGDVQPLRPPGRVLAGLRGEFTAWVLRDDADTDAAALFDDVTTAVALATEHAGLADLFSWTPEHLAGLEQVIPAGDVQLLRAVASLPILIDFLVDTDRWVGSDEALDELSGSSAPTVTVLRGLAQAAADPDAEATAIARLPLVAQVVAFLRWFGEQRPVTATGGLKRPDVTAAAAELDIDLGGRRPTSMWDVPALASLWSLARTTDLLRTERTTATRTEAGADVAGGDPGRVAAVAERLVTTAITAALADPGTSPLPVPSPAEILAPLVIAALTGNPQPLEGMLPEHMDDATDLGALGTKNLLRLLTVEPLISGVDRLSRLGVLQVGQVVAVTPGLRRILAETLATLLGAGDGALPKPDPELAGQALRLKIELLDARPAIWRRVVVAADATLADLHRVIQSVFAWEDAHLHEFVATDPMGRVTRYAAPDPFGEETEDAGTPEADVRLDQVLGGPTTLHYRYDFGDSWDHAITLERTEPAEGPLPRCTAGRGMAPAEDSGGVWGWQDLVQRSKDPDDVEARDWLDLADDETLDPTAFDLAAADKELGHLRG